MKIITVPQGSPEWHQARAGAITASMFATCRQILKSGKNKGDYSAAAKDYAFRLAVERISGEPLNEGFETYAMRRGHELEPEARLAHEARIEMLIEHAGVVLTDDGLFGASADGLINDDGGSEYKCLIAPERIRSIVVDQDLSEYHDQVQGCMWLTGRKWWHFVLYCPALKPAGLDLIIHEQRRDDDYIEALENDLLAFNGLVELYRHQIENANGRITAAA
ncbi:MAG TPA: recombinase [Alcanivorax sp.]|nr:recombinase [Alcanivorax sp.]